MQDGFREALRLAQCRGGTEGAEGEAGVEGVDGLADEVEVVDDDYGGRVSVFL